MSKHVVGIFENDSKARQVVRALQAEGFDQEDVRVMGNSGIESGHEGTSSSTGGDSIGDKISRFFHSLFGSDAHDDSATETQYYSGQVRQGRSMVVVDADDDADADRAIQLMQANGALNTPGEQSTTPAASRTESRAEQQPTTSRPVSAQRAATQGSSAEDSTTRGSNNRDSTTRDSTTQPSASQRRTDANQAIPVVNEELKVGKRVIDRGGVRVYSRVVETPVEGNVRLREEQVRVERRPQNRPATSSDLRPDQTIELTESAEEAVVSKEARVVEEVVVSKDVQEREHKVRDKVRRTEVNVDRTGGENRPAGSTSAPDYSADYRAHFQKNFADSGGTYDDYSPAYAYGGSMAADPRYQGRNYSDVESNLRTSYEERYGRGMWDRFKDAVRYGWDRATGKSSRAAGR